MVEIVNIWERPAVQTINMIAGWQQWADAGSISSGLPDYLVEYHNARQIGEIRSDGFYLFQIPGTHDLVRPVVKFEQGFPLSLSSHSNKIYYWGDARHGTVVFLGDEPHLDIERYVTAFLQVANTLGVRRIIGLGGVYGELPYDKERLVSGIYSQPDMKEEMDGLGVNLSDYHGGASIGSYICRRAHEQGVEFVGLYAFVPTYNFSNMNQVGNVLRIEDDYTAWLGVMRRIKFMLKVGFDLSDLEEKSDQLIQTVDAKVEEMDRVMPQLGLRDYLKQLSEQFTEIPFDPLDDVWEQELRRLLDDDELDD